MGIEFLRFKKPINSTVIYGETDTDKYDPVSLDPTTKAIKALVLGSDGTNNITLKTDSNGRAEVLPANDGTNFKPIKVDSNNRIEAKIGYDGTNYYPIKTDSEGQIYIGNDGLNPKHIRTDSDGRVWIANEVLQLPTKKADIFNQTITDQQNIVSGLTSDTSVSIFRIYAAFDTSVRLDVKRTRGTDTATEYLNSGVNLNANSSYMFDILVSDSDSIALSAYIDGSGTTTATCLSLIVVEIISVGG